MVKARPARPREMVKALPARPRELAPELFDNNNHGDIISSAVPADGTIDYPMLGPSWLIRAVQSLCGLTKRPKGSRSGIFLLS